MDIITIVSGISAAVQVGGEIARLAVRQAEILKNEGKISEAKWEEIITDADLSDSRYDQWRKEVGLAQ